MSFLMKYLLKALARFFCLVVFPLLIGMSNLLVFSFMVIVFCFFYLLYKNSYFQKHEAMSFHRKINGHIERWGGLLNLNLGILMPNSTLSPLYHANVNFYVKLFFFISDNDLSSLHEVVQSFKSMEEQVTVLRDKKNPQSSHLPLYALSQEWKDIL